MTELRQEDIDEARKGQAEYWGRMISNLDFFRTTNLSKKNIDAVRKLNVDGAEEWIAYALLSQEDGYEAHARYWMDHVLQGYLHRVAQATYEAKNVVTPDEAITFMEFAVEGAKASLKGRFP